MSNKHYFPKTLKKNSTIITETTLTTFGKQSDKCLEKSFQKISEVAENESNELIERDQNVSKKSFKIKRK